MTATRTHANPADLLDIPFRTRAEGRQLVASLTEQARTAPTVMDYLLAIQERRRVEAWLRIANHRARTR